MPRVHIGYRCNACNQPVSLVFDATYPPFGSEPIELSESFKEIIRPAETFELNYLPASVASDFEEALKCYSASCLNAFAAMCRRSLQSAAEELGAEGSTKVQNQLKDLREMGVIDDEAFEQLKQIMLDGHDGAHPHLPSLNDARASVLLELMRDVLYQLFVRKAKIREAADLRKQAISARTTAA